MSEPHDIVIFGPGAIGLVLARYFHKDGHSVGIVGRKKWADTLGDKGALFIRKGKGGSIEEKDHCGPDIHKRFVFYGDHNGVVGGLKERGLKDDGLLVLASKTPNLEEVLNLSKEVIIADSNQHVLMIQNGICPELRVQDSLKESYNGISNRLVSGIVMANMAITDFANPKIEYGLAGIILGSWNDFDLRKESILRVESMLNHALFGSGEVSIAADQYDYRLKRFEKAALNGANVLSTLFDVKVGELLDNPALNQTMREKLLESSGVVNTQKVDIDKTKLLKTARHVYDTVVRDHYASMTQDLHMALATPGRLLVTEIRDLDLAFDDIGRANGVSTPFNRFYGSLMEDFTLTYNTLKCLDAKDGTKRSEVFVRDFLDSSRGLADIQGRSLRITPEDLAHRLYESFQELKSRHLDDSNVPFPYNYNLEERAQKPTLYVLVVDDEKGNADINAKSLRLKLKRYSELVDKYDVKVETAYSGNDAVEFSKDKDVAVVLSDVVMPGMKGHQIRKYLPLRTSFVFYSARATAQDRSEIRRTGKDEFLPKIYTESDEITDAVVVGIDKYLDAVTKDAMF